MIVAHWNAFARKVAKCYTIKDMLNEKNDASSASSELSLNPEEFLEIPHGFWFRQLDVNSLKELHFGEFMRAFPPVNEISRIIWLRSPSS